MAKVAQESVAALPRDADTPPTARRWSLAWIGVAPFFLYIAVFLLLPTLWLVVEAFQTDAGGFTLAHVQELFQSQYVAAYLTRVKLSAVTAITGGVFGLFVAYAAVTEGAPRWIRPTLTTFAGVAANFAGVPLAFAFVATLGTTGLVTRFLADHGVPLYANGFTLYSFTGLALVYTYFQLPLMILVISPALDGLRRQWREAATNMGATSFQYWLWVGLPILWPSLLGAMVLLFGNAFSAYATAYAISGSTINLVPILIGSVLSGNLTSDPQFGDALALGMIVIIGASVILYAVLQRRSNRWLR
jgi:putative spermidine/putrescine transport system permease protein